MTSPNTFQETSQAACQNFRKLITPISLIVLMVCFCLPANAAAPDKLRCEYHQNPLGIDITQPRLSWLPQSDARGWRQSAYQILCASSQFILDQDQGDLWDSGKVASGQSNHIEYVGKVAAVDPARPLGSGSGAAVLGVHVRHKLVDLSVRCGCPID